MDETVKKAKLSIGGYFGPSYTVRTPCAIDIVGRDTYQQALVDAIVVAKARLASQASIR